MWHLIFTGKEQEGTILKYWCCFYMGHSWRQLHFNIMYAIIRIAETKCHHFSLKRREHQWEATSAWKRIYLISGQESPWKWGSNITFFLLGFRPWKHLYNGSPLFTSGKLQAEFPIITLNFTLFSMIHFTHKALYILLQIKFSWYWVLSRFYESMILEKMFLIVEQWLLKSGRNEG